MSATPAPVSTPDQQTLLAVQEFDTRLLQLEYELSNMPQREELNKTLESLAKLEDELLQAKVNAGDQARELSKAEADVQQVVDRQQRNEELLMSGSVSAKDVANIQNENATLQRRKEDLEEIELQIMEEAEQSEKLLDQLKSQEQELQQHVETLKTELHAEEQRVRTQIRDITSSRQEVAADIASDLLGLYEQIRTQKDGLAAALVQYGRCGACRMEFTTAELSRIRMAPANEVLRCEECRRILVRTEESGL